MATTNRYLQRLSRENNNNYNTNGGNKWNRNNNYQNNQSPNSYSRGGNYSPNNNLSIEPIIEENVDDSNNNKIFKYLNNNLKDYKNQFLKNQPMYEKIILKIE